jgi:hypothetical protein
MAFWAIKNRAKSSMRPQTGWFIFCVDNRAIVGSTVIFSWENHVLDVIISASCLRSHAAVTIFFEFSKNRRPKKVPKVLNFILENIKKYLEAV